MMEKIDLKDILNSGNILPLAFLGDSIHTLYVRQQVLATKALKLGTYHKNASFYCKASSQAASLKGILPDLREDENDIVRRARNTKTKHQAKNASSADYSYATAFESLIGYVYLKGDMDRLEKLLAVSIEVVTKGEKHEN